MSAVRVDFEEKPTTRIKRGASDLSLEPMARALRVQVAGGTYHVTSRGNRRQSIYIDDDDRQWFLAKQGRVVARCGWRLHAYCLMTNHFHLLIETPKPNLSWGMQRLKCEYAAYFNERHSLDGHLFQQRFESRLIEGEEYYVEVLRYIAMNPVRAEICDHPSKWPWSSFFGLRDFAFDR